MEERINKKPLKAAIIAGISTFIGFSIIFPLAIFTTRLEDWFFILLYLFYFVISGQIFIGLGFSLLIGLVTFLFFRYLLRKKISRRNLNWAIFCVSGAALIIGFFIFFPTKKFIMGKNFGKEKVWKIDANGDKKIDKWVHTDIYGKTMEIDYDTNFDGKPDVREYYKDGKVYKKETDEKYQ